MSRTSDPSFMICPRSIWRWVLRSELRVNMYWGYRNQEHSLISVENCICLRGCLLLRKRHFIMGQLACPKLLSMHVGRYLCIIFHWNHKLDLRKLEQAENLLFLEENEYIFDDKVHVLCKDLQTSQTWYSWLHCGIWKLWNRKNPGWVEGNLESGGERAEESLQLEGVLGTIVLSPLIPTTTLHYIPRSVEGYVICIYLKSQHLNTLF